VKVHDSGLALPRWPTIANARHVDGSARTDCGGHVDKLRQVCESPAAKTCNALVSLTASIGIVTCVRCWKLPPQYGRSTPAA